MNPIQHYWEGISTREQHIVIAVSAVFSLTLFYLIFISPLITRAQEANQQLNNEQELSVWVAAKSGQLEILRETASGGVNLSLPINQVVTASARRFGLVIERLQPQQSDLQVWLKPLSFETLVKWLENIETSAGISVKFIELTGSEQPGMVEIKRLQLTRE